MTTSEMLLGRVRDLEPIIRQHAAAADRDKRLAAPVASAMHEAGLYRIWRPTALGGFELEPVAGFRVLEEVARIDSAAGWNLQISNAIDMFGAWFADDVTETVFRSDAILAGAFNPLRRAERVDGGYRVSGRTPFVSGAHQGTAFLGQANVFDRGEMRVGPDGVAETLMTVCPAGDVQIIDNWNTLGMCGTGSHDVVMDDVFVPASRAIPMVALESPGRAYQGPLYRLTVWPAVAALAAPALGIASASIEEAVGLITKKTPAYATKTLKDKGVVQSQLAQAAAKLGASRAYLYAVFEKAWSRAVAAEPISIQLKGEMQLAATNAVLESAAAVDLVHAIVGTSGVREEYAFEKHFRDIHVITQHGFINAAKLESVGQIMLGLEPEWPFFSF